MLSVTAAARSGMPERDNGAARQDGRPPGWNGPFQFADIKQHFIP